LIAADDDAGAVAAVGGDVVAAVGGDAMAAGALSLWLRLATRALDRPSRSS